MKRRGVYALFIYFFLILFFFFVLWVCLSLQYMSGFGNEFSSEDPRCPGALPEGQVKHTSTHTHLASINAAVS